MGSSSKPRGIRSARKLRNHRRVQRWAQKSYKKKHLGTALKANPFEGASHAKGIVLEKIGIEAKQPNSAIRKCCRVQLIKNGKKIAAFVPNDGCLNFVDENDEVLVAGFGRKGHSVGDIPGVRFKVVKVAGVALRGKFSFIAFFLIHMSNRVLYAPQLFTSRRRISHVTEFKYSSQFQMINFDLCCSYSFSVFYLFILPFTISVDCVFKVCPFTEHYVVQHSIIKDDRFHFPNRGMNQSIFIRMEQIAMPNKA